MALALAMHASVVLGAQNVVHFWLAPAASDPVAPTLYVPPGATTTLHLWARPAEGFTLRAFALNLVAEQLGIVDFSQVLVANPPVEGGAAQRFQLTFDSTAGLLSDADGLRGFQGFNLFPGGGLPTGVGVGQNCAADPECTLVNGVPTWRIAAIDVVGLSAGATDLFLEIGTQGIWQSPNDAAEPSDPTDTAAVFGAAGDVVHAWGPAALPDRRNAHAGSPDAIVQIATADFNQNGWVEGQDWLIWQRGFQVGQNLSEGDATGDHLVDAADLAAWTYQWGWELPLAVAGVAVPEPNAAWCMWAAIGSASCLRLRASRRAPGC
jgi:hypothetical protein